MRAPRLNRAVLQWIDQPVHKLYLLLKQVQEAIGVLGNHHVVPHLLDAAEADFNAGFRRHLLLTQAATEAGNWGLSELRERAEMAMQNTDPDSLGWTVLGRGLTLPRALFNGALAHIDAAEELKRRGGAGFFVL